METYADYGIIIDGSGKEVRCICPQCTPNRKPEHKNEKDLCVNTEKNTWFCQHCGWAGILKPEKVEKTYIKPIYKKKELPFEVLKFFSTRGISLKTLEYCKIGYLPKSGNLPGAIMFPRYKNGEVVAIKYRTHDKRMWQSKSPEPCFYNFDNAKATGEDVLIIVEGEIDCLTAIECGETNVVSVPDGAPNPGSKNMENAFKFLDDGLVENFQQFILAVDNDDPGQFLAEQLTKKLGIHRCLRVEYPLDCKDINDVLVKCGKDEVIRVLGRAKPFPIDGLYNVKDMTDSILELYRKGLRPGLSTGWESLDKLYTVRTCEMTIVTGIPGSGKSTWLDNLIVNMNRSHGWKTVFCSPENWPVERHMASIIEKLARRPFAQSNRIVSRMSEDEVLEAIEEMDGQYFFTQLPDEGMNIDNILSVMHAAVSRHGVKGIVLDPWNELEYRRPTTKTETEFVSETLGQIRRFARLNNVHVWIVAHPTKMKKDDGGKYPVPTLYDCSGSANFYNKADNGISIHRPNRESSITELWVQKIRFKEIGQLGSTQLSFAYGPGVYNDMGIVEVQPKKKRQKTEKTVWLKEIKRPQGGEIK